METNLATTIRPNIPVFLAIAGSSTPVVAAAAAAAGSSSRCNVAVLATSWVGAISMAFIMELHRGWETQLWETIPFFNAPRKNE